MCALSAAYSVMELHVNTMYHAAKKRGRGVAGARGGGGRGWGLAASIGLLKEYICFVCWRGDGWFDGDRSLGGGGYVGHFPPSPSLDRLSFTRNARKNRWVGLLMLYMLGGRVMGVSMVIAAWGEGVGVLVSPSPSPDRLSCAKTRVKIAGWVPGHAPIQRACPCPPASKQ
jgi:hypothetical protein